MVTTKEANAMLPISLKMASDAFAMGYEGQGKDQQAAQDRKLKELLGGQELEAKAQVHADNLEQKELDRASRDANSKRDDALRQLLAGQKNGAGSPELTPAQKEYEKLAGKKMAEYEVAGGKAVAEKNIGEVQAVADELKAGKRDDYDRIVGGALSGFPAIMGMVAPTEKGRRDRAYNAAIMLAKQSDPNPTEKQIANIMGQIYDPASTNEENTKRISAFQGQQKSANKLMEDSVSRVKTSGYAMGPDGPPSTEVPESPRDRLNRLRAAKQGK